MAAAVRPTDPALLHYRSGAFYCARADQVGDTDPIRDVLRGLVAAATEPIAGGRHKVFGHPKLAIVPTTSTIASHLPRAVGLAYAIEQLRGRTAARGPGRSAPARGDARPPPGRTTRSWSARSATRRSTTRWPRPRSTPPAGSTTPGPRCRCCSCARTTASGISVRSPEGWVEAALRSRPGLRYLEADGCDLRRHLRRGGRGGRLGPRAAPPGRAAPAHGPADGARRGRRRGRRTAARPRSPPTSTATRWSPPPRLLVEAGLLGVGRAARPLRRGRLAGAPGRRGGDRRAEARQRGRGGRAARARAGRCGSPARSPRPPTPRPGPARPPALDAFGGKLPEKAGPLTLAQTINATPHRRAA